MPKFRLRKLLEAEQFNYIDGIDGVQTVVRAKHLGLSRNGSCLIWEVQTRLGWTIVRGGDWLSTDIFGCPVVIEGLVFEDLYVEVEE